VLAVRLLGLAAMAAGLLVVAMTDPPPVVPLGVVAGVLPVVALAEVVATDRATAPAHTD